MLPSGVIQQSARILIVDDEPGIRKLLAASFKKEGYEVRVASSGPEAMAICESETFDLLLSDVRMPGGVNGHQLARWVIGHCPATRAVLMSGFDDVQCERCGIAPQPCSILAKPFVPRQAIALVNELLENVRIPSCAS
jgi:DNA-binding NtrC family response regulator